MANISLTGVGAIITLIELGLRLLSVELPEGSVATAVNGVITAVGILSLIWGQLRRGDLKYGLIRK